MHSLRQKKLEYYSSTVLRLRVVPTCGACLRQRLSYYFSLCPETGTFISDRRGAFRFHTFSNTQHLCRIALLRDLDFSSLFSTVDSLESL